jgi:hypothetical protein
MRCLQFLIFLQIVIVAPVFAQEETTVLPYATPGQRYHKQFNPNVEGNFTLPLTFSFRKGFSPPSWLKVDPYSGIVDVIVPSTRTSPVRGASSESVTYDFVLDLRDANGVLVRSMMIELTVTSRPEPLRLPLQQSTLRVASTGNSQTVASPSVFPSNETYGDAPVPARATTGAKLQTPAILTSAATVKPATSQNKLTRATASATAANPPPAQGDPPGQTSMNQVASAVPAGDPPPKAADPPAKTTPVANPRFTNRLTNLSSTITIAATPSNTDGTDMVTLRVADDATACNKDGEDTHCSPLPRIGPDLSHTKPKWQLASVRWR